MAGDSETGVSIIRLVEALDAGPVGAEERFAIGPEDDAGAVYERAAAAAVHSLDPLPERCPCSAEEGATYAEKIGPDDRRLGLSDPAEELVRRVRALSPHIGAGDQARGPPRHHRRARVAADGSFEPLVVQPDRLAAAWTTPPGSSCMR